MRITKITKRVGRTISNRKTFSSVTFHVELAADIEKGETLEEADQKLWDDCNELLDKDMSRRRAAIEEANNGTTQNKKRKKT